MKSRVLPFLGLLIVVAVIAAVSCRLAGHFFSKSHVHSGEAGHGGNSHHWVHEQLQITTDQEKALGVIEQRYQERSRNLEALIRKANTDLAAAILEDKSKSARTDQAVEQIHEAMGEMQKATLDHVFEMKTVLNPAQFEKLLQLTADGLREAGQN